MSYVQTSVTETKNGLLVTYRVVIGHAPRSKYYDERYEQYEDELRAANYEIINIDLPKIGNVVMVAESHRTDNDVVVFSWQEDNGFGWGGNVDSSIRKYRGWRGTTNSWAFYGLGLRECLSIKPSGKRGLGIKIRFGADQSAD